jgi:GntR family transcriptional regulator
MTIDKHPSGDDAAPPAGERDVLVPGRTDAPSPVEFRLDPASGVPTYLQLVHQVEHALRLGYLEPGDQLPRVRDVVASLAINPNTVLKAYRELDHEGLVEGRRGIGTFVCEQPPGPPLEDVGELRSALRLWVVRARKAGLDDDALAALFGDTVWPQAAARVA